MALVLGITGGIGSGKSTVCQVFHLLGIPVFEADAAARKLMDSDVQVKMALLSIFGEGIYNSEGKLNRSKLAEEIFGNTNLREQVNKIVHPVVREAFYQWLEQNEALPYVIYEAAVLFEGGFFEKMDFSILVTAPKIDRILRVMKRQDISESSVKARMKSQWTDGKKKKWADLCLQNDNRNLILPEIIRIDKKLKTDGTIW